MLQLVGFAWVYIMDFLFSHAFYDPMSCRMIKEKTNACTVSMSSLSSSVLLQYTVLDKNAVITNLTLSLSANTSNTSTLEGFAIDEPNLIAR